MGVWRFVQDEVLGMRWLDRLIGEGLSALGLDTGGRLGGSLRFFVYDTMKITLLLCVLIFVISYIQSYFPPERSRRILGRFHGLGANIVSALLGTVTPFCSCSSIPLFIGFTSAGLPLGVTFSFLISSPMVDLGSLVLLTGVFGPLCIAPDSQRRGYGKQLMRYSFERAVELGCDTVVIFGMPSNYVSSGFVSCRKHNVCVEGGKYPAAMLVKELTPGALDGRRWFYKDSPAMAISPEAAQAYDDTLPPKKRLHTPTQEEFYILSRSFVE